MRASLFLCLAAALVGAVRADCDACIDGQCYRKHHLPGVARDTLDIDRNTNTLYSTDQKSLTQCHLDTGLCNEIPNTKYIHSVTVNQHTGATYGRRTNRTVFSLHKFDFHNGENVLLVRDEVGSVTFKDKLYYTNVYVNGIFTYEDGESRIVNGSEQFKILHFIVDKNNDIYFISYPEQNPVRRLSKGVVDEILNDNNSYYLTVDRDGNAIAINMRTHFVYRVADGQRTEIGAMGGTLWNILFHPPLFDRDNNIIYKVSYKYYHLKRDSGSSCTIAHSLNGVVITETRTANDTRSTVPR